MAPVVIKERVDLFVFRGGDEYLSARRDMEDGSVQLFVGTEAIASREHGVSLPPGAIRALARWLTLDA